MLIIPGIIRWPLLMTVFVFFVGCKKEDRNYSCRVTVVNAVPNSAGFTVGFDNYILDSAILYGRPEFDVAVPATTAMIQWKNNLSTNFDSSFIADLPNGTNYTLLFFDSLSRYQSYFVKDEKPASTGDKQGFIRLFPMIINASQLRITNDTFKVLLGPQNFGSFFNTVQSFTAIDSFTTQLRLFNNNTIIDSLPNVTVAAGKSYSLYAIGVIGATGEKRPRLLIQEHL